MMMAKSIVAIGVLLLSLGNVISVTAQSDAADDSTLSGGLLAGGLFPPELLAGSSLRRVFSPAPDMSDALKGFQTFLSASPNKMVEEPKVAEPSAVSANAQDTPLTAAVPPTFSAPVSIRMMPFAFPSIRNILQKMHASPISVQVIPLGHMSSEPKPFFPLSRPLQSLRSLASLPMFSTRSVTITSDGTKTVRQETSHDADGNVVTTTTTTTRVPKSDGPEPVSGPEMRAVSSSDDSRELVNTVLADMPSELKEILGLTGFALPESSAQTNVASEGVETVEMNAEDNVDKDEQDDAKSDDVLSQDDEKEEVQNEKSDEPYVVEFGDVALDSASKDAVLNAVAEELNIDPSQMRVASAADAVAASKRADSSLRAWEAAATGSEESAPQDEAEQEVEPAVTEQDENGDVSEDESEEAGLDEEADNGDDEEEPQQAVSKQSMMEKLQALEKLFAAVN